MLKRVLIKKYLGALWLTISLLLGSFNLVSDSLKVENEKTTPQKSTTAEPTTKQLHGEVEVSFKIGGDGKADIISIESENPDLVEYVRLKLNKIQLEKDDINIDEVITYRFIFKKEA